MATGRQRSGKAAARKRGKAGQLRFARAGGAASVRSKRKTALQRRRDLVEKICDKIITEKIA